MVAREEGQEVAVMGVGREVTVMGVGWEGVAREEGWEVAVMGAAGCLVEVVREVDREGLAMGEG